MHRRAFLFPGVVLAIFTAVLLVLASMESESGFYWCLAGLISLTNLYLAYLWCGKKMPFPYLVLIAILAFFLDMVLSPAIVAVETRSSCRRSSHRASSRKR